MGPRARVGFTFIEMLVVMIVIGVLATLAYARLQSQKERATVAAMTSDLRVLAEEQEAYYFQNRAYSIDLTLLNSNPSSGDTITILEATVTGWSGRIHNPKTAKRCYIFVGNAVPPGSASREGVIDCS